MKDLIVATLKDIEVFPDLGQRVYQSGALGHGDVPAKPDWLFCLFRRIGVDPYREVQKTARSARHDFLIYIYDERGSYKRIEETLVKVRDTLISKEGTRSPSGHQCTGVEWFGTSADLVDKELNSNTQYATVRITANQ